ncbi:2-amino-4-hydroxy-6-hydroxymethyldihydropteridine diphosphokinase [Hydrogenimonas sp.]
MKRETSLEIRRSRRFPGRYARPAGGHRVVVGVGGNLGDVPRRFDRVLDYLRRSGRVRVLRTSPLLKNPPFGYLDQPDFFNAVVEFETRLSPFGLLRWLLWVERRFGRRRSFPNAPRTLDLDIIFYDELRWRSRRLEVPHPRYAERVSVTIPLTLMEKGPR